MIIINSLKNKFSNEKFILDETSENLNSMENAKCLITDSSGIAIEFVLLFKRPVLYFDDNEKIHNTEFEDYNDLITMDQKVKETFGYTFRKGDIKDLDALINKSILEFKNKDIKIKDFIDDNFYNYGSTIKSFNNFITKDL
jgi:CDP-glycerol glycerophosphotransferase (TagB/SpsB family)